MPPRPPAVKRSQGADHKRHRNANGNRRVHTHPPLLQVTPCTGKEGTTGKQQHRQAEHPTGPTQQMLDVGRDIARFGDVGGPRIHHDLHHANTGHKQPPQHFAAFGQPVADAQGLAHRQQPVTGFAHSTGQPGDLDLLRVPLEREAAGGSMNLCLDDPGQVAQRALYGVGTGSTEHALHHQHRLGDLTAIHIDPFGEFFLFDGIVKHRKIVADLQRPFGSLD